MGLTDKKKKLLFNKKNFGRENINFELNKYFKSLFTKNTSKTSTEYTSFLGALPESPDSR